MTDVRADVRADIRERLTSPVVYRRADDPRVVKIQELIAAAYKAPALPVDVVTWFVALVSNEIDLDMVAKRAEVELGRLVAFSFPDGRNDPVTTISCSARTSPRCSPC